MGFVVVCVDGMISWFEYNRYFERCYVFLLSGWQEFHS